MNEQLRAYLMADAGVAALVGTRVTWTTRKRGTPLPAIVLHQISGIRQYAMSAPSGLVMARVQIDCWAADTGTATNAARAVNRALGGLRTALDGVQFQGVFLELEQNLPDAASPPEEQLHRVSQDYIIWHSE